MIPQALNKVLEWAENCQVYQSNEKTTTSCNLVLKQQLAGTFHLGFESWDSKGLCTLLKFGWHGSKKICEKFVCGFLLFYSFFPLWVKGRVRRLRCMSSVVLHLHAQSLTQHNDGCRGIEDFLCKACSVIPVWAGITGAASWYKYAFYRMKRITHLKLSRRTLIW